MIGQRNRSNRLRGAPAWGLIWGAAEATIGHVLHWIPAPGLAGSLLIPVGLWAMLRAVRATGRPDAAFVVATIAAVIKMADLFLPGRGLSMALRPALAILTEGLFVSLALAAAARPGLSKSVSARS